MIKLIYSVLLVLLFVACSDNPGDEAGAVRTDGYTPELNNREDSLFHEVMEGHDIAMAKMGKLIGARKKIEQRIDSLTAAAAAADKKILPELRNLDTALQQAENGMNEWMEKFEIDSAANDETARLVYLESERTKVNKVRDDVLTTLKRADSILARP